ncbi:unnamed protein product, partial [Didymodactylos carnosus]
MLMKGLRYIIPCQNRINQRRSKTKSAKMQYDIISNSIKKCVGDNQTSITDQRATQAFTELEHLIYQLYKKALSNKLYRRARREYKQVKKLQKFLHSRPDIILCQIDKSSGFYIGDAQTIELKAYEYMTTTNAYKEITNGHCPLAENSQLYDKLYPKTTNKSELAHFHGLPKVHKVGIPLRPIIAGIYAPATAMSKFLNSPLAPIYLKVARKTTFIHSIDVVRQLEIYITNGHFKPTTKFITGDVKNLYTIIPRKGALETLIRFLEKHSKDRHIGTLHIDTIFRMTLT